jgi:cold shock CspA family protein
MARVMLFVDGTWLYQNMSRLQDYSEDENFQIDFSKLPRAIFDEVSEQDPHVQMDYVRGYMFGAYPVKVDPVDEPLSIRQRDFYLRQRDEFFFEVETYPVNFKGRRIRRTERDPSDPFHPRESQASISLAVTATAFALSNAFDIAVFLVGDRDFKPAIRAIRQAGKRVAIASMRNACTPEFSTPADRTQVADFDTVWLDELVAKIQLIRTPHMLECQGPAHEGEAMVWTTYYPRPGQKFYCDDCREKFEQSREEHLARIDEERDRAVEEGEMKFGAIKTLKLDKGFGFVSADTGEDYFFHFSDLEEGIEFTEDLQGMSVSFYVVREPSLDKAGAATQISLLI